MAPVEDNPPTRPTPSPEQPAPNRETARPWSRRWVGLLILSGTAALTTAVALWTAAAARFLLPVARGAHRRKVVIGTPESFPPNSVDIRFAASYGIYIVCHEQQGKRLLTALRTQCTHLGCITTYRATEQMFKCPCHGSAFRLDGVNVDGPAPRPLERCGISRRTDGRLEVDLDRTFRAELGQWADPASFVVCSSRPIAE